MNIIRFRRTTFVLMLLALLATLLTTTTTSAQAPKPLKVLLITGGPYHDYNAEKKLLTEGISKRANVEWTVYHAGDKEGTAHKLLTAHSTKEKRRTVRRMRRATSRSYALSSTIRAHRDQYAQRRYACYAADPAPLAVAGARLIWARMPSISRPLRAMARYSVTATSTFVTTAIHATTWWYVGDTP